MITLKHLSKTYQTADEQVLALSDVSVSFDQTGLIAVVGPSGCGKTTLLNLIGGLDRPTSGDLLFMDQSTASFSEQDWNSYRNQYIGFVFQNYVLIPHLTILENVALPLLLSGIDRESAHEKAQALLMDLGLSDKIYKKPNQLSGGQQQRAAIARALIHEPTILLADEPTGSLDHASSIEIMNLLKDISKDRLVILVTHQMDLAKTYASRTISLQSGEILSDQPSNNDIKNDKHVSFSPSKMSFIMAWKLSFSNLIKRRYRAILMVLAASLGIMGMALVLATSYGFDAYIESRKTETLNAFPIRVERVSFVVPVLDERYQPSLPEFPSGSTVYPSNIQYEFQTINTLTADYYDFVQTLDPSLYDMIHMDYRLISNFIINHDGTYYEPLEYIKESESDKNYLSTNFDIIEGRFPEDDQLEAYLLVDRYNRLSKDIVQSLGFSGNEPISFDDLLGLTLSWVPNDVIYAFDGANYAKRSLAVVMTEPEVISVPIVGIVRLKEMFNIDYTRTGIFYTKAMTDHIREEAESSEIVIAQLGSTTSVIDGSALTNSQKEAELRSLGYATYPLSYTIYSKSFENKDQIVTYLKTYNDTVPQSQAIEPLDLAGIGLSTMRTAIDAMALILIVFSAISLIISNALVGIMTYTSVLERTKEIGLLRSIGARKQDIRQIFYAETMIIGMASGLIGILMAYALQPLVNLILLDVTTIPSLTQLPWFYALGIISISIIFTSFAGIIPAQIASKKDPIVALRSE